MVGGAILGGGLAQEAQGGSCRLPGAGPWEYPVPLACCLGSPHQDRACGRRFLSCVTGTVLASSKGTARERGAGGPLWPLAQPGAAKT